MPEQTADRRSPSGNLSESLIVPFGQSWKYTGVAVRSGKKSVLQSSEKGKKGASCIIQI